MAIPLISGQEFATKYRILAFVGEGGMGAVYSALDLDLHREVAIKLLSSEYSSKPKSMRREALILSKLKHPNILEVFALGIAETQPFLVTELVNGLTLSNYTESREPSRNVSLEICRQIASALEHMHKSGILHRDLKPDNILVSEKGDTPSVRLIDFGLSKTAERQIDTGTLTGALVGTPRYMSPEQCRGLPADERSDIYAFGCVACELFTGQAPFNSDTPWGYLGLHTTAPPTIVAPVKGYSSNQWRAIERLIHRCLEKQPSDRFASASELLDHVTELQSAADGHEICFPTGTRLALIAAFTASLAICAVVLHFKVNPVETPGPPPYTGSRKPKPLSQESYESMVNAFQLNMLRSGTEKTNAAARTSIQILTATLLNALSSKSKELDAVQRAHCYHMFLLLNGTASEPQNTQIKESYGRALAQLSGAQRTNFPVSLYELRTLLEIAGDPKVPSDQTFCEQVLNLVQARLGVLATISKDDIVNYLKSELPVYHRIGRLNDFIERSSRILKELGDQSCYLGERCKANFLCASACAMLAKECKINFKQLEQGRQCARDALKLRANLPETIDTDNARKTFRQGLKDNIIAGTTIDNVRLIRSARKAIIHMDGMPSKADIADVLSTLDSAALKLARKKLI